jgi:hypothetical protein
MSKLYEGDPFDGHLTKSDLAKIERGLRMHYPISPATQARILRKVAAEALRKGTTGRKLATAARVVQGFQRLQLAQAALDLERAKFEASKGTEGFDLSKVVAQAEAIALAHKASERPES